MTLGELLTRWTIRVAVLCYLGRVAVDVRLGVRRVPGWRVVAVWSLGAVLYLAHVAAAFAFVHDWSHAAAYRHTAAQTAAVTGWHWGGGVWINYGFTLLWPVDAVVLWSANRRKVALPRWYVLMVHAVFAFLMFNATAVFGPPFWRPVAVVVVVVVLCLRLRRARAKIDRSQVIGE